ncbi:hypothetical protein Y032_0656g1227 [Ancylostoma ceylanicum]|uniref:Uncharacterized protein n=1 Tax=Ancylostoma ceylanicum TaxID=53326 RepID=A0A016WJJ9_9BILA|nr:hypothetical protein Y032_0656g1227 [Ancylostoma ceylanicum]
MFTNKVSSLKKFPGIMTGPTEAVIIVVRVRPIGEWKHVPILVEIQRIGFRRASICILIYCPIGPVSDAL